MPFHRCPVSSVPRTHAGRNKTWVTQIVNNPLSVSQAGLGLHRRSSQPGTRIPQVTAPRQNLALLPWMSSCQGSLPHDRIRIHLTCQWPTASGSKLPSFRVQYCLANDSVFRAGQISGERSIRWSCLHNDSTDDIWCAQTRVLEQYSSRNFTI
jgi:hypothetical protein